MPSLYNSEKKEGKKKRIVEEVLSKRWKIEEKLFGKTKEIVVYILEGLNKLEFILYFYVGGERRETAVEEEENDSGSTSRSGRPQYVSANCVVFIHYTGDVQAVVEEHFTRALNYARDVKDNTANTKGNKLL